MDGGTRENHSVEQASLGEAGPGVAPDSLPSGTVTFLFTDIEGSTLLLDRLREQYAQVLAEQRQLLREVFQRWHGHEVDTQGDAFFVAFGRAADAIACAIEAQQNLAKYSWPQGVSVHVRMGLHTGEPLVAQASYVGMDVHRASRIASVGYGGQVLLSQTTRDLVCLDLPVGIRLRDLGAHLLKDIRYPQEVYQLEIPGLQNDFPPLKSLDKLDKEEEPPAPGKSPYMGLQYFDEADTERFFGRKSVTDRLVEAVNSMRFLAVIGASGSGKSSVVRAGLVPAIKAMDKPRRLTKVITPSSHPLEALAICLTSGSESITATATLIDDLQGDPRSLHLYCQKNLAKPKGTRILLVIDQFEELFTLCRSESERWAFVQNLLYAVHVPDGALTTVITLRADFYEHLAQYAELREMVSAHQIYIGAMNASDLRQAIEEPARLGGWELSPGLVDLILSDLGAAGGHEPEPGALPLLSHALLETWKRRRGNLLNLKAYWEAGGVRGAIAKTAESVFYRDLTADQQVIARDIFLRLTELGEGTQDTRRRISIHELIPPGPAIEAEQIRAVLAKLADARLITTGEGTVEVAHEALIREWPTLREWLDSDREGLRLHRHLTEASQEWELLEHDLGALYRGTRLSQALEWAMANPRALNLQEQAFLEASRQAAEHEQAEREAQRQRELEAAQKLAEAERQRAEEHARSAERLRRRAWQLGGVLVLALILAGAAVLFGRQANTNANLANQNAQLANQNLAAAQSAEQRALGQQATAESERQRAETEANQRATAEAVAVQERNVAEQQTRLTTSRELSILSKDNLAEDQERSLLLAMQAVKTADIPEAENALHLALQSMRLKDTLNENSDPIYGVDYAPHVPSIPDRFATGNEDGTIKIWEMDENGFTIKRQPLLIIANPTEQGPTQYTNGHSLSYNNDGSRLAAIADKNLRIWDSLSGTLVYTLTGHTDLIMGFDFSPDGELIATCSEDGTVKVWDAHTGLELLSLTGFSAWVDAVTFSPDGNLLAAGDDTGLVLVWPVGEMKTAAFSNTKIAPAFSIQAGKMAGNLAFSPDNKKLAVAFYDIMVFDISTATATTPARLMLQITAHDNFTQGLLFTPDGNLLISGAYDGLVKVWDASSGKMKYMISGNPGGVISMALSSDGQRLLTSCLDSTVHVWDLSPTATQEWITVSDLQMSWLNIHRDHIIAYDRVASEYGIFQISADGAEKRLGIPFDSRPAETGWTLDPDLSTFAIISKTDFIVHLWDLSTGKEIKSFSAEKKFSEFPGLLNSSVLWIALSPGNKLLATGGDDGTLIIWDVQTGQPLQVFSIGSAFGMGGISFSPDGALLSTGNLDGSVRLWNSSSGELLHSFPGNKTSWTCAAFSPDGTQLLASGEGTTVNLWDVKTGENLLKIQGYVDFPDALRFSGDGKYLVIGRGNDTIQVLDAKTGKELLNLRGILADFTPNNQHLIAGSIYDYRAIYGYILDINELMDLARSRLTRTWTQDECSKFLHMDTCPPTP